jgi:hypothetical protein
MHERQPCTIPTTAACIDRSRSAHSRNMNTSRSRTNRRIAEAAPARAPAAADAPASQGPLPPAPAASPAAMSTQPDQPPQPPAASCRNPLIMTSNSAEESRACPGHSSASGLCLSTGTNDERTVTARGLSASLCLCHL